MKPRYPYLFALALTLPLASCRFVGARPDFSVMGDALSPVESDTVYVESKPTGSTHLANYRAPAPTPAPAQPQQASAISGLGDLFSPAGQQQPAPNTPQPAPSSQVQPPAQPSTPGSSPALYTVRPGDSLARIARAHRVPLGSLASVNGIDLQNPLIKPGQQLRIPQGGSAVVGAPRATAPAPKPAPAAPAASTVPALKPALKPSAPAPATAARPAAAAKPATAATMPPAPKGKYRVCAGDTLYRIARRHGITLAELLRANNLSEEGARNVRVGTLLTIPASQP